MTEQKNLRFARFSALTLGVNILVIVWGALVRATGSGAGCGSHWPLCNGEVIPRAAAIETLIEFTHRLSSGAALLLVIGLFIWSRRAFPHAHRVRLGANLSMFFIITEALIGAGLVLFEWVGADTSAARAASIVVHLLNTFVLLAVLTLTTYWAFGGPKLDLRGRGMGLALLLIALIGTMVIGASGALAALGDTLFPVSSLGEGLRQDFSPTAHFLIRLRILHPTIAIGVGIYLILYAGYLNLRGPGGGVRLLGRALTLLVVIQLGAGLLNVLLLAPVWMQLVHLLLADMVWIGLILLVARAFRAGAHSAQPGKVAQQLEMDGQIP